VTFHRTAGETRDCRGCRYWSEMLAGCTGGGPVKAVCLAPKPAPRAGAWVHGGETCTAWASGHLGAVDEPGQDPDAYASEVAS
jgi:hypothetical protein